MSASMVVYDTILSAIHNWKVTRSISVPVVYDTILSAIHNSHDAYAISFLVVYDTILSAIHNRNARLDGPPFVEYDISIISKNAAAKIRIMIDFTK